MQANYKLNFFNYFNMPIKIILAPFLPTYLNDNNFENSS